MRRKAGLLPRTEVELQFGGEKVTIVRAADSMKPSRGARLIASLKGKGDVVMSTDEIMVLTRGA